jgi:hypothetical protein
MREGFLRLQGQAFGAPGRTAGHALRASRRHTGSGEPARRHTRRLFGSRGSAAARARRFLRVATLRRGRRHARLSPPWRELSVTMMPLIIVTRVDHSSVIDRDLPGSPTATDGLIGIYTHPKWSQFRSTFDVHGSVRAPYPMKSRARNAGPSPLPQRDKGPNIDALWSEALHGSTDRGVDPRQPKEWRTR